MTQKKELDQGNREYRSDVFSMLMNIPENALSVYNALNGTNYTDPSLLEIKKLDKGIYLSVRNDASFLLDAYLNLYEHQSTVCPNMPLRCLIYVTNLYDSIVVHRDLFGKSLVQIPTPKFVVFYNGKDTISDQGIMRLSDAFLKKTEDPELELICKVININHGHSHSFLEGCRILKEYSLFVDSVRRKEAELLKRRQSGKYLDDKNFMEVLEKAIDECVENHILEDFLRKHRNEVLRVTTLDYSNERRLELTFEEGRVQGIELLSAAITDLKAGKSKESLLNAGIPEDIIDKAIALLS